MNKDELERRVGEVALRKLELEKAHDHVTVFRSEIDFLRTLDPLPAEPSDALAALKELVAVLDLKADLDKMSANGIRGLLQRYHERKGLALAEARRVIAATGEKHE